MFEGFTRYTLLFARQAPPTLKVKLPGGEVTMANKLNIITGVAALALVFGAGPAFAQYGGNGGGSPQTGRQPNSPTSDNSQTRGTLVGRRNFCQEGSRGWNGGSETRTACGRARY